MRIVLIGHHVAPIAPPFAGGVESMTWYLARWLARRGHDVTLHAPPGSDVPGVDVQPLQLKAPLTSDARADISMPPARFMDAHHAYQRLMLELTTRPQWPAVVHNHSLHYLPVAMSALIDAPMLLTLHCPPTPWLQSALVAAGESRPELVAVSRPTRRTWERVCPVGGVIENGIDLDAWSLGPGGEHAAWSGRIVPEKAPHLAIDAARRAGLEIELAGPIVDRGYWETEVQPRLGPDARYAGHLDHSALAELLARSAVFLMSPVWDEPFGLVAAEALACGTPVAAFARGGLCDVIAPTAGALAEPGDVASLATAARRAMRLPRSQVRAHASACLGIGAMGEAYEDLYDRIGTASMANLLTRRRPRTRPGAAALDGLDPSAAVPAA